VCLAAPPSCTGIDEQITEDDVFVVSIGVVGTQGPVVASALVGTCPVRSLRRSRVRVEVNPNTGYQCIVKPRNHHSCPL